MQRFDWNSLDDNGRQAALLRPAGLSSDNVSTRVRDILADVKAGGDTSVLRYTQMFDCPDAQTLSVPISDCKAAWEALPDTQKTALKIAKANIEQFHAAQQPATIQVETMDGVLCQRLPRPMSCAGLYVPGGTAPLVSTLLMLAIPAKTAGVPRRVVTTPPGQDGTINPAILAAAYLCDVTDIFACGGAQAIAALAYGTDNIPRCDKIFGPGNAYVAAAKSMIAQEAGGAAIDLPAGPSEAMVVGDKTSNPAFIASDLLSQAEHDRLAQVICIADSAALADRIETEIAQQLDLLPRRDIARVAMSSSRLFIADERESVLDIINRYAPEHLILQCEAADDLIPDIQNAGSIFVGPWTPESVGDYASGTNHTLPTFGAARSYSGVTLDSFFKYISVQKLSPEGLSNLAPTVMELAQMEELEAHRRAVEIRVEALNQ